ncbi:MAG: succinic semialdehyde dehydrogenase [Candidatus Nanopelagicales bacterium]|jgi:succinate-semialdehyde dehydrogenase/glutarate-semialdehyde dehydrogenase|nr:succinic semialdehyde dehydrogenase [Candidatus Nanopelagicales bacterium]
MTAPTVPALARPGFDAELAEALLTIPVVHPGAQRHASIAPFDGQPLVELPYSTVDDVDMAFDTATQAQARWAQTEVAERRRIMLRFHDLLLAHQDECLDLIQWETGKTRMDAMKELLGVCTIARHYARAARRMLEPERPLGIVPLLTKVTIERHPVGVVANIAPWNYPLFLAAADAIPALMAGNAVVLKPDHQTSLTALYAVDLLHRAGIPRRVLQVVLGFGPELGPELVERADYVMFTGSSAVGSRIAARCGERLIGCSMELGGKNPMIVLDDADPAAAAEVAVRACFDNAGQLCVAMERLYVMADIHDAFMERFLSRIRNLRMSAEVGWAADYGSLIGAEQLGRTAAAVEDAVSKGAEVLVGGRSLPDIGPFYYAPTLLTGVTEGMQVHGSETFGPVVAVQLVDSEDEALALANDSPFGLNASVLTRDERRGQRLARRLRTGSVNVNEAYEATFGSTRAPMGGMGRSGLGRRNGAHGLTRFTEEQTIAVQRGIGFGTPFGMEHDAWSELLVKGFRALRRSGLA